MTEKRVWTLEEIAEDLRRRVKNGKEIEKPTWLKGRYGIERNSQFFPMLDEISRRYPDLSQLVEELWEKSDPRDLNFRSGECHCEMCRDD